jgi:hypothetical protein
VGHSSVKLLMTSERKVPPLAQQDAATIVEESRTPASVRIAFAPLVAHRSTPHGMLRKEGVIFVKTHAEAYGAF